MSSLSIIGWLLLLIAQAGARGSAQQSNALVPQIESQIRSHNYDDALALVQRGLHAAPRDYQLWTLKGIVLSLTNRTADASRAFETALNISPGYPAALRGEVEILYGAQDKRAVPLLKRILKENPNDQTAHEMLAMMDTREDRCADAVEQFKLTGEAVDNHPASLQSWGKCLILLQRPGEAADVFKRLSDALPDANWPRYNLAVALVESGKNDPALKVLQPMLAVNNRDPDVLSLASEAYESAGNTPRAVALLRHAIVLNPNEPRYYLAFAAICMGHESFQVGVDMLSIGIRHKSGDASLYLARGTLYAQLAQYDLADADFRTAEKFNSAQSLSAYAIDLTKLQKSEPTQITRNVHQQLAAHPDSPLLHYLLAKVIWSNGDHANAAAMAEARSHATMALRLKPEMTEARDLLADMDIAEDEYGSAAEQCRLALRTDSTDQTAIYHLIVALRHMNQPAARVEIPTLVRKLSTLQQESLKQETARKSFSLVEEKTNSQR